jgi:hypothetical protein
MCILIERLLRSTYDVLTCASSGRIPAEAA